MARLRPAALQALPEQALPEQALPEQARVARAARELQEEPAALQVSPARAGLGAEHASLRS